MSAEEEARDVGDERQEFLERRLTGIGATDGPKILGLSRWGTPLSVYNEKVGVVRPGEMSLPAWLGIKMQNTVAELYTAATGQRVRADNRHHRHPRHDWMVSHLDFRAWARPRLLVECKTKARMKGWGEDGSANVPVDVWVQVQHEMEVTGAEEGHVAVLFGHHTYRTYRILPDPEFIAQYIPRIEDFWLNNVLARVAPLPTGHVLDREHVRAAHPDVLEPLKAATPEQGALASTLRMAILNKKQAALHEEGIKNRLIEIIGPAEGLVGPFGQITYRKSRDSTEVAWEQVANAYRRAIALANDALAGDLVYAVLREAGVDLDAIESVYTSVKPGTRRFLASFVEDN